MLLSTHRKLRSQLVFEHYPILVGRIFRARSAPQLGGCYFLAPLTVTKGGSKGFMVLRVRAYTNSVPDQQSLYPDGQHTLAFYIKNTALVGRPLQVLLFRLSVKSLYAQDERLAATSPNR